MAWLWVLAHTHPRAARRDGNWFETDTRGTDEETDSQKEEWGLIHATDRCFCPHTSTHARAHTHAHTHTSATNQRGTYWHALTDELSKWFYKEIKRILIYAISLCPPSSPPFSQPDNPSSLRLSFPHGPGTRLSYFYQRKADKNKKGWRLNIINKCSSAENTNIFTLL